MAVPKKVVDRIQSTLKSFQAVLLAQKARDVSEADTVTIVNDLLSEVFGFDKYSELTSEHAIRGTFCDLAIKLEEKLVLLAEVKAIGIELKDGHVKQAVDYASNQGCEWVVLTNGIDWRLYQVIFKKPIDKQEVLRLDLTAVNPRAEADLECLYILTREGLSKNAIKEYRDRKDATSRFMLAAILLQSEDVQSAIRREIRKVSELLVDPEVIVKILRDEVIKRETTEGEQAESANRRVMKSVSKNSHRKTDADSGCAETAGAAAAALAPKPGGTDSTAEDV